MEQICIIIATFTVQISYRVKRRAVSESLTANRYYLEVFLNRDMPDDNGKGESKSSYGVHGTRNLNMTETHRAGLQQLKERDLKIDIEIVMIGEGVDGLHELAKQANEEVRRC